MARRRGISTEISVDKRFNRVISECGPLAGILYVLMIPHSDDDASITGDIGELMMTVIPGMRSVSETDVGNAIECIVSSGLLVRYTDGRLAFPVKSFYKHQSYIPSHKRVTEEEQQELVSAEEHRKSPQITEELRDSPKNPEELRDSPQITASPSPSPSPSPSHTKVGNAVASAEVENLFEQLWSLYPKKRGRGDVKPSGKAKLLKIGFDEMERAIKRYCRETADKDQQFTMYGGTFFNSGYLDYLDGAYTQSAQIQLEPQRSRYKEVT